MGSYSQLDLLGDFDKYARRDFRLVEDLVKEIHNLKYFRINTRFSELPKKLEIEEALNQAIYWIAFLSFKKARFVEKYKGKNKLEDFLDITKEKTYTAVQIPLEQEVLSDYYRSAQRRINTTFMAYKDLLRDERAITKRILDSFDLIHTLSHVV